jgi:PhnB protein
MTQTSIAPWLSVSNGADAVSFYTSALGATEAYRLEGDRGEVLVAQLLVDGAPMWVSEDPASTQKGDSERSVRMILTVDDPDAAFRRAVDAGAAAVAPVADAYGWRTGRVSDPFGFDWEFTRRLDAGVAGTAT